MPAVAVPVVAVPVAAASFDVPMLERVRSTAVPARSPAVGPVLTRVPVSERGTALLAASAAVPWDTPTFAGAAFVAGCAVAATAAIAMAAAAAALNNVLVISSPLVCGMEEVQRRRANVADRAKWSVRPQSQAVVGESELPFKPGGYGAIEQRPLMARAAGMSMAVGSNRLRRQLVMAFMPARPCHQRQRPTDWLTATAPDVGTSDLPPAAATPPSVGSRHRKAGSGRWRRGRLGRCTAPPVTQLEDLVENRRTGSARSSSTSCAPDLAPRRSARARRWLTSARGVRRTPARTCKSTVRFWIGTAAPWVRTRKGRSACRLFGHQPESAEISRVL